MVLDLFIKLVVRDMYYTKSQIPSSWKGWSFWEGFLVDPEGNRYSPSMVRTSIFTQELAHELTASPLQIYSLKRELKKRLNALQESPEVIIRWHGEEIAVKLPKAR
jgi:hypothetical protein